MTSASASGGLTRQLTEYVAQIPGPVALRLAAAFAEVTPPAPRRAWPSATGHPIHLAERDRRAGPARGAAGPGPGCAVVLPRRVVPVLQPGAEGPAGRAAPLQARGASLIAVSPQSPDRSLSVTEKAGLSFDVLSDIRQQVIAAYRVQFTVSADIKDLHLNVFGNDLLAHTADGSWDLPIPATFVIDRSGIIRTRHVSPDYTTRMDPGDISAALAALS